MRTLPPILRLGTRGSLLARTQSQLVADTLTPHLPPGTRIELVIITTAGDKQLDKPLQDSGGKGLFVKELDEHLLKNEIDFTVHSAKDVPAQRPAGLLIAATPPRQNPADIWIAKDNLSIQQLPPNSLVGTASLRRQAQLLALRPDLRITTLRGNIDTRLRKVATGADGIAATFLAAAGLLRTNLLPAQHHLLPVDQFIPAAGQGTLAIECRADDTAIVELLKKIHDPITHASLTFERQIIHSLAGSCLAPIGVCAQPREIEAGGWIVRAIVASPDGKHAARCTLMERKSPHPDALDALVPLMLETLIQRGAKDILATLPQPPSF